MNTDRLGANHISDDMLIDALYGLAGRDVEKHIGECKECAARWNELEEKRGSIAMLVNASAAEMVEQRRNIFRRIEHPSWAELTLNNAASKWAAPAVAGVAACVLAISLMVHHPAPANAGRGAASSQQAAAPSALGDAQVFSDAYAMEQSFEPSASASLGVLFERPDSFEKPDSGANSDSAYQQ